MQRISHEYDMNYLIAIFCCGVLTYLTFKLFELYFLFSKSISLENIAEDTRQVRSLLELYLDDDESEEEEEEEEEEQEVEKEEVKPLDEKDKVE